jgi:hypothetical protein
MVYMCMYICGGLDSTGDCYDKQTYVRQRSEQESQEQNDQDDNSR